MRVAICFAFALAIATIAQAHAQASPPTASQLEAALDAQPSATKALAGWCDVHHLAAPATISATPVKGEDASPSRNLATLLGVSHAEPLGYRHVRLACGGLVLSEAHNWYVVARLTPEMNARLATTDTPFGTVAAPLHFSRVPLASRFGRAENCPAGTILSHRALLRLPSGAPLALVVECYTRANLAVTSAPMPSP